MQLEQNICWHSSKNKKIMNLFYSSIMSKKTIDEVFKFFIEKNISNVELTGGIQYDKNILINWFLIKINTTSIY